MSDARLVEALFTPEARSSWLTIVVFVGGEIKNRGERMVPLLNAALRDPRCFEQGDLPQPAQYLLWYLTDLGSFESAAFVAPNAERCAKGTRSHLVKYLACSGCDEVIPALRRVLANGESSLVRDCYEGLLLARDAGRASHAFLDAFRDVLERGDEHARQAEARRHADPRHQLRVQLGIDFLSQIVPFSPTLGELDAMPPERRAASLAWTLLEWVRGDGFHFYFDSYGSLAPDTPDAFETIGAHETAALVRRCLELVGEEGVSTDNDIRNEALRQLAITKSIEVWDEYDSDLFSRSESDEVLLMRYVLEHRERFRENGGQKSRTD